jgi:NHL repeat-containing protein
MSRLLRAAGVSACLSALVACSGETDTTCDQNVVGNICTIAGNLESGYSGDDGPALEASLSLPQDTLTSADGTIYVLDWNNHRIRKLTGGLIQHVAGRGELGGTLDDPANDDFNHPTGMLFTAGEQRMIISAWHNSKIRTLDLGTTEIVDTCGDGRRAYWGDNGPATSASLDLPSSVAWDPQGNLVIMDQANQVLRYIDSAQTIHPLYGRCVIDAPPPSGPGACADGVAPVNCPSIGGSASGKSTCGDPALTCGNPCTPGYNGDDIPASEMRIAQPFGQSADPGGRILFDAEGSLYFADTGNALIRRIDSDGIVHRIAGLAPVDGIPQRGYSGDGGPATEAQLNNPVDLALAPDGTLYFTDVYNHCVRAIDPEGVIRTAAGVCGQPGYAGDGGPAQSALLKRPYGLELSGGKLLISDTGNNLIRTIRLQ